MIGQPHEDIPNVGITINNKLVELSHVFEDSGISMFYSLSDDYDLVSSSFIGDAVINDLVDKLTTANESLLKYSRKIKDISDNRSNKLSKIEKAGPIKKTFLILKEMFSSKKLFDLKLTEEEKSELDSYLIKYDEDNNEILNYNLEDNILKVLVKEISGESEFEGEKIPHKYSAGVVPGVLEESVIPDLKKLGLEELIPVLKKELTEVYKKDVPDSKFYQVKDKNMHLYVPDFTKKTESINNSVINDSESMCEDEGIGLIYGETNEENRRGEKSK